MHFFIFDNKLISFKDGNVIANVLPKWSLHHFPNCLLPPNWSLSQ